MWKNDIGIPQKSRTQLYSLIRRLVYEKDLNKLNDKYNVIMKMSSLVNDKMQKYISDLWNIKDYWSH